MAEKMDEMKATEDGAEDLKGEELEKKDVGMAAAAAPVGAIASAPAAMKRSMPMAVSICVGILLAAVAGIFFYRLMWFILLVYLSFIAATVCEAPVHWLTRHGIRRGFAAVIVTLSALSAVVGLLTFVTIQVLNQGAAVADKMAKTPERVNNFVNGLKQHFPGIGEHIKDFNLGDAVSNLVPNLSTVWANALIGVEIISGLVIMFFMVLYMLVDGADHLKAMRGVLPRDSRLEATKLFNEVSKAHRGWAFASATNVCSATLLLGTGLWLVGIPGAYVLGLVAGLGELIPNIGPFLGAMPALIFTLVAEPEKFWYVLGVIVALQLIQSYTISPMMLRHSVELPVLVTIMSVIVFGTLFGFLGVVVAIPLVADMVVVWAYVNARREKDATDYDAANEPVDGERAGVGSNRRGPRLRGLFRRNAEGAKV